MDAATEAQTKAKAASEPEEPEYPEFEDMPWQKEGKSKELVRNEYNLRLALKFLRVSVGFNEFNYKEEVIGLPNHGPWLDNAAIDALWARIWRECGMKYPKGDSRRCCFR